MKILLRAEPAHKYRLEYLAAVASGMLTRRRSLPPKPPTPPAVGCSVVGRVNGQNLSAGQLFLAVPTGRLRPVTTAGTTSQTMKFLLPGCYYCLPPLRGQ
jgi:hypothetical protein